MKILCLGDSITAGIGGTVGNSYPDVMQKKLKKRGIETEIINNGRPGDSTKDFLNYIQTTSGAVNNLTELIPWFKPIIRYDVVIIMLGTNDCRTDNWVESVKSLKYLEGIIEYVVSWIDKRKNVIINTLIPLADPMPPKIVGGAHEWKQDRIEKELNPGIEKLAGKKSISFFNLFKRFQKELESGTELYDGIHPYNSGYKFIGEQMAEYILDDLIDE